MPYGGGAVHTAWGRQTFLGRDSGYVIDRCRQTPAELEGLATYAPLFFSVGVDFHLPKGGACLRALKTLRLREASVRSGAMLCSLMPTFCVMMTRPPTAMLSPDR